ncbi:hypothetical protein [Mucilaginibacter limnophilus]|uniref:hypothetical protein n=1 Tax=Mucilaginibacter limnophilus TaxID=1932778 RepID=UPI0013E2B532|nr:hypothetical protein [Mucilaginibacter limnophilus]
MKKIIICAAILLTSGITAWSFNRKENGGVKAREEAIEKTHFSTRSINTPISDIATAD